MQGQIRILFPSAPFKRYESDIFHAEWAMDKKLQRGGAVSFLAFNFLSF